MERETKSLTHIVELISSEPTKVSTSVSDTEIFDAIKTTDRNLINLKGPETAMTKNGEQGTEIFLENNVNTAAERDAIVKDSTTTCDVAEMRSGVTSPRKDKTQTAVISQAFRFLTMEEAPFEEPTVELVRVPPEGCESETGVGSVSGVSNDNDKSPGETPPISSSSSRANMEIEGCESSKESAVGAYVTSINVSQIKSNKKDSRLKDGTVSKTEKKGTLTEENQNRSSEANETNETIATMTKENKNTGNETNDLGTIATVTKETKNTSNETIDLGTIASETQSTSMATNSQNQGSNPVAAAATGTSCDDLPLREKPTETKRLTSLENESSNTIDTPAQRLCESVSNEIENPQSSLPVILEVDASRGVEKDHQDLQILEGSKKSENQIPESKESEKSLTQDESSESKESEKSHTQKLSSESQESETLQTQNLSSESEESKTSDTQSLHSEIKESKTQKLSPEIKESQAPETQSKSPEIKESKTQKLSPEIKVSKTSDTQKLNPESKEADTPKESTSSEKSGTSKVGEDQDVVENSSVIRRRQSGRRKKLEAKDADLSDDSSDEDSGIYAESHRNSRWIQVVEEDEEDGIGEMKTSVSERTMSDQLPATGRFLRMDSEEDAVFTEGFQTLPKAGHKRSESTSTTLSENEFKRQRSYKSRRRCLIRRQESQQEYHRLSAKVYDQEKLIVVEKLENETDFGLHILDSHPAFITSVDPGSPAERCGVREGQIVISVNGVNTLELSHKEIVQLVQKYDKKVKIEVAYSDFQPVRDLEKPVMAGFMMKLGTATLVKIWKKRFFVLRHDNCLYYYKNEQELDPLGAIPLSGYCISRYIDTSKDYCFKAEKYGAKTYYFMTDSREEMTRWVGVLTEAAARCKQRKDSWLEVSSHNVGLPALEIRRPECTGLLTKLGQQHKTWQKRYCVLKDACIYYYKSMSSLSAKGVVHLHGYTVDATCCHNKKFSFVLHPPIENMRTFYFCADNQTDKQRWVDSLIRSIQRWIKVDNS